MYIDGKYICVHIYKWHRIRYNVDNVPVIITKMDSDTLHVILVAKELLSVYSCIRICLLGAPLIAVFGNHLAHRSISTQVNSWWLIAGSLSFNIFITCFTILILLFFLIYNITVKKIKIIRSKYDKESEGLKYR